MTKMISAAVPPFQTVEKAQQYFDAHAVQRDAMQRVLRTGVMG